MKTRRQAVDLTDLAIGLVVLGIVVTIGASILLTTRDARLTELDVSTVVNETITLQTAGDSFANRWFISTSECINTTSGETINPGNYTVTVDDFGVGSIVNATTTYGGYDANCTYTHYDITRADWALADNAATGIAEFGNWFKIIVIVGIAAVILSLIFLAFGKGSQESSVTY